MCLQTDNMAGREIESNSQASAIEKKPGHAGSGMSDRTELVGRVAAGLAHDLNGPIGVVLGFTQLAREKLESLSFNGDSGDAKATASVVEYLKMIESAGENARSLARDMWDFSKAVAGEEVEYDFTELLETSARLVAPSLRVAAIEPPASGELQSEVVTGRYGLRRWLVDDRPTNGIARRRKRDVESGENDRRYT